MALNVFSRRSRPLAAVQNIRLNAPLVDSQLLIYDGTLNQWQNESIAAGASALNDFTDVNVTATADHIMVYDGAVDNRWESVLKSTLLSIDEITDTNIVGVANNEVLQFGGGSTWDNVVLSLTFTLDELSDVTIAAPANNQYLQFSSGSWDNATLTNTAPTSGSFTPTFTNIANTSTFVVLSDCTYIDFSSRIIMSGTLRLTITASSAQSTFELDTPPNPFPPTGTFIAGHYCAQVTGAYAAANQVAFRATIVGGEIRFDTEGPQLFGAAAGTYEGSFIIVFET